MNKHKPVETNIGHNTWGPVCTVCGFDLVQGMSDTCELGKRLYDYHWLPNNQQINFEEPTEVKVEYIYQPFETNFPEPKTAMEKITQWAAHGIINKQLINTKYTFIRDGQVIKELNFPKENVIPADEWKEKYAFPKNTLVSLGNTISTSVISKEQAKSKTPFLDFLEANAPITVNDWQYRFAPDPPKPKIIGEI
jgi:hypothetical protein